MKQVIFNQKGGVGKSSIATNLAAISAHLGKKTLIVDLDVQANSSQYVLGERYNPNGKGIADFFEQFLSFRLLSDYPEEFVLKTPLENLDLLPATPKLADLHNRLEARHKIYKLKDALKRLESKYDAIYIDTPPALNFFTLSALIAAEGCLIPFDCDQFSRQALYTLMENVAEIRSDHNEQLNIDGIVANQYQSSSKLPRRVVEALESEGLPVLKTRLPASVKMRESHEHHQPLIHYMPKHKLTQAFVHLYEELMEKHAVKIT